MRGLLGLRDRIALFWSGHDFVLQLLLKFILVCAISLKCIEMSGIKPGADVYLPALAVALAASFLPGPAAVIPLCVWIAVCAWICSMEAAIAAGVLILLFLLLYYSFFPGDAWVVMAVVFLCQIRIPSAAVLAGGLFLSLEAVPGIAAGCFLAVLPGALGAEGLALAGFGTVTEIGSDTPEHVLTLMEGALSSEAWVITAIVLAAAFLVVYALRSVPLPYMAFAAVLTGLVSLIMLYGVRGLVYPAGWDFPQMVLDLIAGLLCAMVVLVFRFTLDYRRTEFLQFEDDDYYYYVKAVPKMRPKGPAEQHLDRHEDARRHQDTRRPERRGGSRYG